jgi:hypothetical protein
LLIDGICVERNDRIIDRTVPAGDHVLVVDTFVDASGEASGDYTLVILACEPMDPTCG